MLSTIDVCYSTNKEYNESYLKFSLYETTMCYTLFIKEYYIHIERKLLFFIILFYGNNDNIYLKCLSIRNLLI